MAKRMRLRSCSKLSASRNRSSGEGSGPGWGLLMEVGSQLSLAPALDCPQPMPSWLHCRNHMSDYRIQKQQENYMAQVLDQKHKKASGTRQARSHQRPREK